MIVNFNKVFENENDTIPVSYDIMVKYFKEFKGKNMLPRKIVLRKLNSDGTEYDQYYIVSYDQNQIKIQKRENNETINIKWNKPAIADYIYSFK